MEKDIKELLNDPIKAFAELKYQLLTKEYTKEDIGISISKLEEIVVKRLKVLEIIITKRVDIANWDKFKSVEHYNDYCINNEPKLTQEEYNLIDEVVKSYECKR